MVTLPVGAYPFDLAFSPDGKWLAAVGDDGTLTVLDTRTWTALHESVEVHDGLRPPGGVAGRRGDGRHLGLGRHRVAVRRDPRPGAGAGIPGSADGRTGQTHIFPPVGNEIVVSTEDGPGRRYPMDTDAWVDHACDVAGRDLTEAEWNRFLPNQAYRRTCTDR